MRIGMIARALAACLTASLTALPALAQSAPDPCKPIGKTEDGRLVYSLRCNAIPAPPKPAAASAETGAPAPVVEEEDKGGLFGRAPSFVRPTADSRAAGSGPAQPR